MPYPQWHFEENNVLPDRVPQAIIRKIPVDNALDTYRLLRDDGHGTRPSRTEETVP